MPPHACSAKGRRWWRSVRCGAGLSGDLGQVAGDKPSTITHTFPGSPKCRQKPQRGEGGFRVSSIYRRGLMPSLDP